MNNRKPKDVPQEIWDQRIQGLKFKLKAGDIVSINDCLMQIRKTTEHNVYLCFKGDKATTRIDRVLEVKKGLR